MTLTSIISEMSTKKLKRLYNSQKSYFHFKISVFNVGAVINAVCTDRYKEINRNTWNGYDFVCENDDLIHYIIQSELLERNELNMHYFRFVVPEHYQHRFNTYKQALKIAKKLNESVYLTIYLYKNKYKEPYNDMKLTLSETIESIKAKKAILLDKTRKYF
jgi:hypothetical protein